MAEPNNNSYKTTFKVKHLDEYHDIVIDWNDDRHEYKYQQVFEQLESITGVPNRYTDALSLVRQNTAILVGFSFADQMRIQDIPDISEARIYDGECFHLRCSLRFEWRKYNRICMDYMLVAEEGIPEGVCILYYCQYKYNEAYFKNIKDIVVNEELNKKISQVLQPVPRGLYFIADRVFRMFNIRQYFGLPCIRNRPNFRPFRIPRHDYLRTRG